VSSSRSTSRTSIRLIALPAQASWTWPRAVVSSAIWRFGAAARIWSWTRSVKASSIAPIGGTVGDRPVELGDYVQPGSRHLTLAPLRTFYVTANFKETQVSRIVAGPPATVRVDAMAGKALKSEVDSFARWSGSQF
jgi:membrane fusion protein (multidrug efflux system)